ncbi:unnamed protein product, partial [Ectocarpus fasciculatus]
FIFLRFCGDRPRPWKISCNVSNVYRHVCPRDGWFPPVSLAFAKRKAEQASRAYQNKLQHRVKRHLHEQKVTLPLWWLWLNVERVPKGLHYSHRMRRKRTTPTHALRSRPDNRHVYSAPLIALMRLTSFNRRPQPKASW